MPDLRPLPSASGLASGSERLHKLECLPSRWPTLLRLAARSLSHRRSTHSTFGPSVWRVDRVRLDPRHVQAYAAICDLNFDPGRLPLLYPQLLGFPLLLRYLSSSDCPWPAMGMVHLANEIDAFTSISVDDDLQMTLEAGTLSRHPKGQVFSVNLGILRGEQRVWQARQTFLRRGVQDAFGPDWDEYEIVPRRGGADQLAGISLLDEFDAPLGIGRRYAPISGDFNPIHLSSWAARLLGFERSIAHGLWSLARSLAVLDRAHPGTITASPLRLNTVFGSPVRLPSRVGVWAAFASPFEPVFELRDLKGERVHLRAKLEAVTDRREETTA